MNSRYLGIIAFAAGLLVPAVVLAQTSSPADSTSLVSQLQRQEQRDEFKAKFWSQEPITQQDYYVQEKQDRQLAARLSAGEPVSQSELEQALTRIDTEY
jgi:aspartokinase